MKETNFRSVHHKLRQMAKLCNASHHDYMNDPIYRYNPDRLSLAKALSDDLQAAIEELITNNELTLEQVKSLESIVYQTSPSNPDPVCAGKIDVMLPYTGFFTGADEALGPFMANLLGCGLARVQGTKTGYMPVRIERPKITDK